MSGIANFFRAERVATLGLRADRSWMNAISNNIANAQTVDTGMRGRDGNFVPYARQVPVFAKVLSEELRSNRINQDPLNGVEVKQLAQIKGDFNKVYGPSRSAARRPGTADAGYVYYPKVSLYQEMADLRIAAASYEANLTVLSTSRRMLDLALRIK